MHLLERSDTLDHLRLLLTLAESGIGHLLFLGGEAGVGKTTLMKELADSTGAAKVLWGGCDPLSTPRPLGPLLDMARDAGEEVVASIRNQSPREQVFQTFLESLRFGGGPTLMVLEDLHWGDEASLDLVRFLGRRASALPALMVVTYRIDEVDPRHPLTRVMGDLATASAVSRRRLEALSKAAVTSLALGSGLDAEELYRRSGGNPFLVTELLAQGLSDVPETVRDAILARSARLPVEAQRALRAAAVLGSKVEARVLMDIAEVGAEAIEACEAARLLERSGSEVAFRHELVREALLSALSGSERTALHVLALRALKDRPHVSLAVKAEHAEGADEAAAVLELASAAAREASGLHSHREAAAQYARALRFAAGCSTGERAFLLESQAFECYLTDRIEEALQCREAALALRREEGDLAMVSENLRGLSRLSWFLGKKSDADRYAREAISVLAGLPPRRELGMAWSNLSQLCMLEGRNADAIRHGEPAIALARALGDREIEVHALNNVGTVRARLEMGGDWSELEESLRLALELGYEDHVARALTNFATSWLHFGHLAFAERWLEQAIAYATDHDLDAYGIYLHGCRAIIELARGRWDSAVEMATEILEGPSISAVSRIQALVILGLVWGRRGGGNPWPLFDEALALAIPSEEMQRIAVVRLARIETAWLAGDTQAALRELEACTPEEKARCDAWYLGRYAYWQRVLGAPALSLQGAAEPWVVLLRGDAKRAFQIFRELGHPFEAAQALMAAEDPESWREAYETFLQLGAYAVAAEAGRRLRASGVRDIPRVPRASTRTHQAGLTLREREVLELLAQGFRNADIAARLFVSSRTVDHHVSAILGKIGARTRLEAAAWFNAIADTHPEPEASLPRK